MDSGYHVVGQVAERGEASLRAGIVDVFAPYYPAPLRIELVGDEVESIRTFDPSTQRSTGRLAEAAILPAREVVAGEAELEGALRRLRGRCRELGKTRAETAEALEALRSSPLSPLREALFPYFHDGLPPLWAHLPAEALVVFDEGGAVEERARGVLEEIELGHARALERGQLVPEAAEAYVTAEEWEGFAASVRRLDLEELESEAPAAARDRTYGFATRSNQDLTAALRQRRSDDGLLAPVAAEVEGARDRGWSVWFVARSPGSAQRLRDLLEPYGVALGEAEGFPLEGGGGGPPRLALGHMARGFRFPAEGVVVLTEAEILGEKVRRPAPQPRRSFRSTLADLEPGHAVVHADFGVGLYRGLARLEVA
ncbi:MAG: hypothetical protein ACYDA8_02365, partial [Deferrisomatales bacterium]